MSATIHLTLEQLAEAIAQLTPEELERLEILLDPELTQELLRRSSEYEKLKHEDQLLTLAKLQVELQQAEKQIDRGKGVNHSEAKKRLLARLRKG